MACSNCSRRTLELFLRSAAGIDASATLRPSLRQSYQTTRHFSAGAQWTRRDEIPNLSIISHTPPFTPTVPPKTINAHHDASTREIPESVKPRYAKPASPTETPRQSKFSKEVKERKKAKVRASKDTLSVGRPVKAEKPSQRPLQKPVQKPLQKPLETPSEQSVGTPVEKESWKVYKAALQKKFQGEHWSPRKKLSPDTMDGIRHLHKQAPEKFTTPVLADHFKVSPEAVRRILKSKWRPSDAEYDERMRRWEKRGEMIWTNLVDLGVRPPKRWREMGVGKAERGAVPKWKSRWRNQVAVNDSIDDIPLVDEGPGLQAWEQERPIAERIM